ncbi:MAG: DNA topoisomerase IV subunit A, partial [Betaproteobacteria bacterium]|nr:DNA topoisomerase IV subunit A [Betaproteobacteria bacterium]
ARLPFGLLNGSFGIPVGFSTRIPSHNLREVAAAAAQIIRHPKTTVQELLEILPGPDFPGGGQIIAGRDEIRSAYETGRGSIAMRARWQVEQLARGQWRIVITELPHGVSCRQVLEEIEALVNPKPSTGKKETSQEQRRLKQFMLEQVETVRDESDRKSKLRLVIEPRSSRQSPEETMKTLLVHTSLEARFALNLTWIGLDGLPETKDLATIFREWGEFRVKTVQRRSQHRLDKCEERLHIVMGRLLAFVKIDEIIALIRSCEDQGEAKNKLREKFNFTERQAEDIVNLRLGQLTRLDGVKLNEERKALEGEEKGLKEILADEKVLRKLVIAELQQDSKTYGDERRTLIKADERSSIEHTVLEEPITVIVSKKGWVRGRSGHAIEMESVNFKDGDARHLELECKTTDTLTVLAAGGKCFSVEAAALPSGRGDGAPINTLINSGPDDIVWIGLGRAEARLLMSHSAGNGFLCKLGDLATKTKQGKDFMSVPAGAKVLPPLFIQPEVKRPQLAALSSDARLLVFPLDQLPVRPNGGVGVQIMALPDQVTLAGVAVTDGSALVVAGLKRTRRSATIGKQDLADYFGKRAQRGKLCDVGFRPDRLGS